MVLVQQRLYPVNKPPVLHAPKLVPAVPTAPSVSLSPPKPKPPPAVKDKKDMTPFELSVFKRREKIKAKFAAFKRAAVPPKLPPFDASDLLDTTVVEGKTLLQWTKVEDALEAKMRIKQPYGCLMMLEYTMPGWASWAVNKWRARGAPTSQNRLRLEAENLMKKAEAQDAFALMDERAAKEIREDATVDKKAKMHAKFDKKIAAAVKKEEAAVKKREKAEAFRQEAEALLAGKKAVAA